MTIEPVPSTSKVGSVPPSGVIVDDLGDATFSKCRGQKTTESQLGMNVINTLTLTNPMRPEMNPVVVVARVTVRAMHLVIPECVRRQLGLDVMSTRSLILPDGTECQIPYVGPIEIRANGHSTVGGALVMGDEVVLGAIPLGDVE